MKYTENALNILTAKTFKGIGDAWVNKHLTTKQPFEKIVELLKNDPKCKEKVTDEIFCLVRENIEATLAKQEHYCDGITAIGDDNFPEYRGNVKESERPNVLFYRGDLGLLSKENRNIAVIGVLNPDPETEEDERKIVHSLVKENAVIVSGLALGCDTIAHDQTLKSNGVTVAILPSPLNKIIPAENKELADDIVSNGGLLITEYYDQPKSAQESVSRFVKRDRLQTLFSDVVLLSASYDENSKDPTNPKIDSGSRHALAKATEYGIQRAVIYHEKYANNPKYDLNRAILRDKSSIVLNPDNFIRDIDRLFNPHLENTPSILQNEEKHNNDASSDLFNLDNQQQPNFYLELTETGVSIKKQSQNYVIDTGTEIKEGVKRILEHCLNNNLCSSLVQRNIGFIKCFSDEEKQQYILAIKVCTINNKREEENFLNFFNNL